MKFFSFCLSLLLLFYTPFAAADWKQVGKAEYNWGPFHIYTVSLFTEDGSYSSGQRPLMLRIKFAKPVEGKNFAISMVKEMNLEALKTEEVDQLRKRLINNFPDFKPDDVLNYIALDKDGYFVLNDTVLSEHFDRSFNHQFVSIWLDSESSFKQLQPRLLGEDKDKEKEKEKESAIAQANSNAKLDPMKPGALHAAAEQVAAENGNKLTNFADVAPTTTTAPAAKSEEKATATTNKVENSAEATTTVEKTTQATTTTQSTENKTVNTEKPSDKQSAENKTEQTKTAAVPTTEKVENKADTATATQDAKNTDATQKQDETKAATPAQQQATQPEATAEEKDNQDKGKAETDKPAAEEPKVDPEQPIEPPQEVDPIMPYQKQYYC
ncbi:hypothetical protein QV08_11850 [Gallibacterium salpingitidis]|uniref:Chalcone isomerase domain-containing protein n=1 Tax=Gallibacterium salpingitidis TaxID=505341 RepID=A0AB36E5Y8_9PAST|nr:hypothetical protein [Gallibacterium salpingitidis]OBX05316.1 hypothetical protein QV08_11850 [Gallibacterium salpingitidis]OBX10044.1 hypothetical protein QV09_07045 [Gallibacterium salpingitidis]